MPDYLFDFAQRTYEMEIERKDRINASLSLPAGVVALLAGVVALFAEKVPQNLPGVAGAVFAISAGGLLVAIVVAVFYLILAYIGRGYYYLNTPVEWRRQVRALEDYYKNNDGNNIQALVEEDIKRNLLSQYEESAHENFENNRKKLDYLSNAKIAIACGLVALLISVVPYYALTRGEKTYQVRVTNFKEINIMAEQQSSTHRPSQTSKSETQSPSKPADRGSSKPADLKPRIIKESRWSRTKSDK